ncbi:Fpg/Nei family DNA glycosylase [Rathayibacter iranicus]|uniref:DNA-(apurinic or apyrimidinic site) lyase n=2 Tax=Rathayibacter iranicus TaxID=59737 RepID=A0AAD1ABQ6_9MICO|nr:DNA-formamidopyrimidine glycosylase family protein [Rathayibacter iranicus]AZZ55292.1 DNA glycosylase [Rathayibacter iranicus]MWV30987.1 Fpg/Nei family DNA glycosylase [Rathayibacter iranicus NCPPB 2253 = VKM Ac-1602]PPI48081.1 DNA glycosylase [Rathayibacter iranicus]PPI61297.1 DNA glycosylase [Rathayibacter iranicus]PPI72759.1 DNA glycosylase [Rathayibacter iranicus]
MPEGHSVHRIALQFERDVVGHRVAMSSPQGRFAEGAALLDGREVQTSTAVGKHLLLRFEGELTLHVHLGLYGAWDFLGRVSPLFPDSTAGSSIGAPRRRRAVRLSETEHETDEDLEEFPPAPVGAVRVRIQTEETVADLRGPTACEVMVPAQVDALLARLGPDPATDDSDEARDRFVNRLRATATPVGLVLMDQSVVSGIGNIYRAELLYRAGLDPHVPGKQVPLEVARELWADWAHLLEDGIRTGMMITRRGLTSSERSTAVRSRAERNYVYKREGLPCRVCGTNVLLEEIGGRKLYWCPVCQS